MGSVEAARKSVKKSGNSLVRSIPTDDSITARFIEEPSEWFGFYEYWDEDEKTYRPVIDGEETPNGARISFRYLANVYIVDDSAVRALKMPKSVAEQILAYHQKYGTILDRDYDLSRTGSGKNDTNYMVAPDAPSKMNVKRFEALDLQKILDQMAGLDEDDEDDDDERPAKRTAPKKSRRPVDDDDDDFEDDTDDDDEDEDEDEPVRRRPVRKPIRKPIRKPTR